jgi:hypothetical protein
VICQRTMKSVKEELDTTGVCVCRDDVDVKERSRFSLTNRGRRAQIIYQRVWVAAGFSAFSCCSVEQHDTYFKFR